MKIRLSILYFTALFLVLIQTTSFATKTMPVTLTAQPIPSQTLSLIKPDGVEKNIIGEIVDRFEKADLQVVAMKMLQLTEEQAKAFYSVHKDKPFYDALVKYMTSGPIVVQVLEGKNAVTLNRELMGSTDPKKAKPGTIRADFAESIEKNIVHGSDSPNTAYQEIHFFFKDNEIFKHKPIDIVKTVTHTPKA